MVRGCSLNIVLQVPDAIAQSRIDIWLATLAHSGSGSSTVIGAFERRLGGILHNRTCNRMLQDITKVRQHRSAQNVSYVLKKVTGKQLSYNVWYFQEEP